MTAHRLEDFGEPPCRFGRALLPARLLLSRMLTRRYIGRKKQKAGNQYFAIRRGES
jgi:hypothetical protein